MSHDSFLCHIYLLFNIWHTDLVVSWPLNSRDQDYDVDSPLPETVLPKLTIWIFSISRQHVHLSGKIEESGVRSKVVLIYVCIYRISPNIMFNIHTIINLNSKIEKKSIFTLFFLLRCFTLFLSYNIHTIHIYLGLCRLQSFFSCPKVTKSTRECVAVETIDIHSVIILLENKRFLWNIFDLL